MGDLTGVRVLDPAEGISLVSIQPNLFFNGHCAEAANFLGAKVQMLMRNKESLDVQPESMVRKGAEDKILPMNLHIGDTQLMMSDGDRTGIGDFKGLGLTYNVADAERVFARLGDGGQVQMPLSKTFFTRLWHGPRPLRGVVDGDGSGLNALRARLVAFRSSRQYS